MRQRGAQWLVCTRSSSCEGLTVVTAAVAQAGLTLLLQQLCSNSSTGWQSLRLLRASCVLEQCAGSSVWQTAAAAAGEVVVQAE